LWPDGFWCFREEFNREFMRADDYRVIMRQSDEWSKLMDESFR